MSTTTTEQIACVERELKLRRVVFPKKVRAGDMTQAKADHEIACMEDLLNRLRLTDQGEAESTFPFLYQLADKP